MKHESISEDYQEAAALYALGALSQHEARAFENHLRDGCALCRHELEQFEMVADSIGAGLPAVTPPAYLRDLLAARIDRETQFEADPQPQARPSVAQFPDRITQHAAKPAVAPRASAGSAWIAWAVAATIALAALASFFMWQQARRAANELRAELRQAQSEADQQKQRAFELAEINAVLSDNSAGIIALEGQEVAPSASADVYWDVRNNRWVVTADLPPPPAGKVYQLWFVTPDQKISAGLIETDDKGHGFKIVDVPSDLGKLAAAAITLEPAGGSPQPTSPIYALGKAS